jgi:hypothetical protein
MLITILIKDNKYAFHFNKQQLCAYLSIFLFILKSEFKEAEEQVVLLLKVDAKTF